MLSNSCGRNEWISPVERESACFTYGRSFMYSYYIDKTKYITWFEGSLRASRPRLDWFHGPYVQEGMDCFTFVLLHVCETLQKTSVSLGLNSYWFLWYQPDMLFSFVYQIGRKWAHFRYIKISITRIFGFESLPWKISDKNFRIKSSISSSIGVSMNNWLARWSV